MKSSKQLEFLSVSPSPIVKHCVAAIEPPILRRSARIAAKNQVVTPVVTIAAPTTPVVVTRRRI